ncbi:unnamed protein product [Leptosia nina]|uniref:Fatty acyl-CoA reductase n=1 Tax=Leptosia nina TaxID=320188 RepID=A0AAV1JEI7_9NEOP
MTFLEERNMTQVPDIKEYFKGKNIFITGGSGFMGKVLIEKLLYSCTDLKQIYVLLRPKKGISPEDRISTLYESECYDRLRKEKPDVFMAKVSAVAGDVGEIRLGISDADRALLVRNVNIIFHVAASVRFDDTLDRAVKLNLRGTKEMIDLAYEMPQLESFVHVSTSYSNVNQNCISETMYPPHADWRQTIDVCQTMDKHSLEILTPKYLGELPNTYVFTKQLAEHVVYEQKGKMPIIITRPSIVVSAYEEPLRGWNENLNGPTGILIAVGKGVLRTVYGKPDLVADYIPVDFVIKHLIAAAWIRGTKKLELTDDIPVYNCCAGNLKTVTTKEFGDIGFKYISELPLDDNMWGCSDDVTSSRFMFFLSVIFKHLLPALVIDTILKLAGKEPRLVKIQRRIYNVFVALESFLLHQFNFYNNNFVDLRSAIKKSDKDEFYYDLENLDYLEHMKRSTLGARRYILKEKDEDIPKAVRHFKIMTACQKTTPYLFYVTLIWWSFNSGLVQQYLELLLL